jgi:hypothetical protein
VILAFEHTVSTKDIEDWEQLTIEGEETPVHSAGSSIFSHNTNIYSITYFGCARVTEDDLACLAEQPSRCAVQFCSQYIRPAACNNACRLVLQPVTQLQPPAGAARLRCVTGCRLRS